MDQSTMAERWLAERGWINRATFGRGDRDLREELDAEADAERRPALYADDHDVEALRWFVRGDAPDGETLQALRRFAERPIQDGLRWGRGCCPHCSDLPVNPFAESMVAYETVAWSFPDGSMVVDVTGAGGWDVVGPDLWGGRGSVLDMRTHDEIRDERAAIVGAAGGHARA